MTLGVPPLAPRLTVTPNQTAIGCVDQVKERLECGRDAKVAIPHFCLELVGDAGMFSCAGRARRSQPVRLLASVAKADMRAGRALRGGGGGGSRSAAGPGAGRAGSERRSSLARGADLQRILQYLCLVYPAARHQLYSRDGRDLRRLYESLDYFYTGCVPSGLASLTPSLLRCPSLDARADTASAAASEELASGVTAPYLPAGVFFRAARQPAWQVRPFMEATYTRYAAPVTILRVPTSRLFASSHGAKVGPAPSWTSPLATVRYTLHPNGLLEPRDKYGGSPTSATDARHGRRARKALLGSSGSEGSGNFKGSEVGSKLKEGFFDVRTDELVNSLRFVKDEDILEVEQWGGWSAADCPPICGLWANIWRGSGLGLRLSAPYTSLNKATAVAEMLLLLGDRSPTQLEALARMLNVEAPMGTLMPSLRGRPSSSSATASTGREKAAAFAAVLLSRHPCEGAGGAEQLKPLFARWLAHMHTLSAEDRVRAVIELPSPNGLASGFSAAERFALFWLYGVCGVGAPNRYGTGWDGLLASLACMLGVHTVVLIASSNDNGLLHQELVDFELPLPLGWTPLDAANTRRTHSAARCIRPFGFARADRHSGESAEQARRVQLLRFWQESHKFVLPSLPPAPPGLPHHHRFLLARAAEAAACHAAFGPPDDEPSGVARHCKISAEDEESPPVATKACYLWCRASASQAHATASLFHVRARMSRSWRSDDG